MQAEWQTQYAAPEWAASREWTAQHSGASGSMPTSSLVPNAAMYEYHAPLQGWDAGPPFVATGEDGMLGHEEWRIDVTPETFWMHTNYAQAQAQSTLPHASAHYAPSQPNPAPNTSPYPAYFPHSGPLASAPPLLNNQEEPYHHKRRRKANSPTYDTNTPAHTWAASGHSAPTIPSDHNHLIPPPGPVASHGPQPISRAPSLGSLTFDDLVCAIGMPQPGPSANNTSYSSIEMPSVLQDFFDGPTAASLGAAAGPSAHLPTAVSAWVEGVPRGLTDTGVGLVLPMERHFSPEHEPLPTHSRFASPAYPLGSDGSSPAWDMRSPGTTVVSDGDGSTLVMSPPARAYSHFEDADEELASMRKGIRDCPRSEIRVRCMEAAALLLQRYNCRPDWLTTPSHVILQELVGVQSAVERETPRDSAERIPCCVGLAASLEASYAYSADESQLEVAIVYLEEAALLLSKWPESPYRSNICGILAQCHKHRYLIGRALPDLEKSLAMQHLTLVSTPRNDPSRGRMCTRYAACLEKYFTAVRREVDLDLAIKLHREALALLPEGEQADVCSQLATCLRHRFDLTGDERVFDEVILLRRRALSLMPKESRLMPYVLQDLAHALHQRYGRTQDSVLLDDVIGYHRAALAAFEPDDILRAESCANLGVALRSKYLCTANVLLLDEMIAVEEEALTFIEDPSWCGPACWRLAQSLRECFNGTRNPELLRKAVSYENYAQSLGYTESSHL